MLLLSGENEILLISLPFVENKHTYEYPHAIAFIYSCRTNISKIVISHHQTSITTMCFYPKTLQISSLMHTFIMLDIELHLSSVADCIHHIFDIILFGYDALL